MMNIKQDNNVAKLKKMNKNISIIIIFINIMMNDDDGKMVKQ